MAHDIISNIEEIEKQLHAEIKLLKSLLNDLQTEIEAKDKALEMGGVQETCIGIAKRLVEREKTSKTGKD